MPKQPYRQRLKTLFADIEKLAADPASSTPSLRGRIEELRARLNKLEEDMAKGEKRGARPGGASTVANEAEQGTVLPTRQSSPILYEKEYIGYAWSGDVVKPLQESTSAELTPPAGVAVPLIISGQPIGKVLVTPAENTLTQEEANLLNNVAQRASQQIENLKLLTEAERARAEAESATRRFMHESWDSYLDAIHQNERVGYAYDQTSVTPFADKTTVEDGFAKTVKVMEEQVGTLFVKPDPARPLTNQDKEMVSAIADRIAQQAENIRLLADASRARSVAEEATRRLTRESWQAFTQQAEGDFGFVYDTNRVSPLKDSSLPKDVDLARPLTVRGETIGRLAVANWKENSPEADELISAIAERVSVHLETIRLTEELQKRAAELQTVARVSTTASTVLSPDELLQSVVDLTRERFNLYHAHIYLANDAWNTLLLAAGAGETGRKMVAEQHTIAMDAEKSLVARAVRERQAIITNDVQADPDYLPNPLLPRTRAEMAIPMIVGDNVLGVFDVQAETAGRFTEEDANIYTTLTSQVGIALQNARLYAEQAATVLQLRELDRLKSSFLANMSHELRTPLNSILGFADVMIEELDGPLTENMTHDLKLIQKNGQHLLHLINDVLDMAKIESGRMNLNPEQFVIQELFEEVIGLTSSLASERNNSLFVEPDSDHHVKINADRTRLRQVMLNLVNNAIKFTEYGKISVHAVRREDRVLITVRDTGLGIPPDRLEDVFQEFTQVDSSTTRKVGGTGLGLPISRKLIEMHGGRLWAESTGVAGEGSTFLVDLPLEAFISDPVEIEKVTK